MPRTPRAPRIALATCRTAPQVNPDRDLPALVEELCRAGADASARIWDDPAVDWAAFDLVVIRSTWDYSWRAAEFVAWAERCGRATRILNPPAVVRWNTDKRYLGELAARGVPTVATRYIAPGEPVKLPGDHEFVVKPTSGAGARFAARYTSAELPAAEAQIARMHAEGFTAMVQPYARNIDVTGERALLFVGGQLLHASRKGAVLTPGTPYDERKTAHPDLERWAATPAELDVARRALAAIPGEPGAAGLLYARVDLVDGDDGGPAVMELELVEPNFFLWLHPGSLPAVVEAFVAAATTTGP